MPYETSADAYIRPPIGLPAQPAHAAAAEPSRPGAVQTAHLDAGAASEPGAKSEIETAPAEFGFYDLLDVINPLQHIPGISSAYRAFTGDEITAPARILGGFLLGGPIGFVAAIANSVIEEAGGRDLGEAALAMLFGDDPQPGEDLAETAAEGLEGRVQAAVGDAGSDSLTDEPAEAAAAQEAAAQEAAEAQAPAEAGGADGLLTGQAALSALYSDVARRRGAAAPAAPALQAAAAPAPEAARTQVPANLIGLGIRDKRTATTSAPPVSAPAAHPVPAAAKVEGRDTGVPLGQPGESTADRPSPRAYVPGPRVPGSRGVDPTLFNPRSETQGTDPAAIPAEDVSAQMMQALTKYEHMLQERQRRGLP